ncbi:MAG TPA: hypothetical protein VFK52_04110 [Nocardioidaceae bacterium]|nr:hypothetical protein [Nocardioidaceae bacterium]
MTLPRDLQALLRTEVGTFRAGERRRRFAPRLCVGQLAGERSDLELPVKQMEYVDRTLRPDYVLALLETAPEADAAWIARPGETVVTDDDVAWMVAAGSAFGSAGRELAGCYVVTRHGWADIRTGESRVWQRLRLNR